MNIPENYNQQYMPSILTQCFSLKD